MSPRNSSQRLKMFWCSQHDYKRPLLCHALVRSPMAAAVFVNRVKEAFPVPALCVFFLSVLCLGFECWTALLLVGSGALLFCEMDG